MLISESLIERKILVFLCCNMWPDQAERVTCYPGPKWVSNGIREDMTAFRNWKPYVNTTFHSKVTVNCFHDIQLFSWQNNKIQNELQTIIGCINIPDIRLILLDQVTYKHLTVYRPVMKLIHMQVTNECTD